MTPVRFLSVSGHINTDEFTAAWLHQYHDARGFATYLFGHFDRDGDLHLTNNDLPGLEASIDTNSKYIAVALRRTGHFSAITRRTEFMMVCVCLSVLVRSE